MDACQEASKFGICKIVPPKGWNVSAVVLEQEPAAGDIKLCAQRQFISHLCMRQAPAASADPNIRCVQFANGSATR